MVLNISINKLLLISLLFFLLTPVATAEPSLLLPGEEGRGAGIIPLGNSPSEVHQGRFTLLAEGDSVPFESACFDMVATAHLLALPEFAEKEYKLELEHALERERAEFKFKIDGLTLEHDEATARLETQLRLRDETIERLQVSLKKGRRINLPLAIGLSVGAGLIVGGVVGVAVAR